MERGSMSNNTINHALDNFLENRKDKQSISSSLTVEINAGLTEELGIVTGNFIKNILVAPMN